jgi:hypothetical protein
MGGFAVTTDLTLMSQARHLEHNAEQRMKPIALLVLAVVAPVLVALLAYEAVNGHGEVMAQAVMCFKAGLCL